MFLLVGKALNASICHHQVAGNIKGVKLPGTEEQQFILQYADDTSITISAEKALVQQLVSELETFATTSGLVINWEKSSAY